MKVGFGQSSITPKSGKIAIAGTIPCRYVDKVHDDIKATAIVIEDNNTRTIWVCCDMCHPTKRLTDDAINKLKIAIPNFDADEFIMRC